MLIKRFFKTKDECEVTFELLNTDAETAVLVCEANNWQPVPMKKNRKANSPFRVKVRLPKENQFQFRYFVDETTWANDEAADAYWPNEYGGANSVVSTLSAN